jgi:hypothetical protein
MSRALVPIDFFIWGHLESCGDFYCDLEEIKDWIFLDPILGTGWRIINYNNELQSEKN